MRTTLDINDQVLRRAKKRAAVENIPLREFVERALRSYLSGRSKQSKYRLQWRPQHGEVLPGVDLDDHSSLLDLMDGLS